MWLVTVVEIVLLVLVNYGFLSYVYKDWQWRKKNGQSMPAIYTKEGKLVDVKTAKVD
jgi:hypothetical protein